MKFGEDKFEQNAVCPNCGSTNTKVEMDKSFKGIMMFIVNLFFPVSKYINKQVFYCFDCKTTLKK